MMLYKKSLVIITILLTQTSPSSFAACIPLDGNIPALANEKTGLSAGKNQRCVQKNKYFDPSGTTLKLTDSMLIQKEEITEETVRTMSLEKLFNDNKEPSLIEIYVKNKCTDDELFNCLEAEIIEFFFNSHEATSLCPKKLEALKYSLLKKLIVEIKSRRLTTKN